LLVGSAATDLHAEDELARVALVAWRRMVIAEFNAENYEFHL